ncbi:hypothetical protein FVEN_g7611 [Fusarium venenatum]|uniref:Six-hairpin glycosidase-like protein n=1 Tax=Fusarium venenatum TaxID=56646 RepID=UPI001D8A0A0E|nr:hypothetical protein FVEN_g7611 [Fusarium venenatum]KAH6964988.1 Six-hairpin glycosidase-like protein [Fusarium venenatum]
MRDSTDTIPIITPTRVLRTAGEVQFSNDLSHFTLKSPKSGLNAEIVLDYTRCEGGLPTFSIVSASAPKGQQQVTFQVTYSETIEGIDNENGDGPFFLFSNAMDSYRVCCHEAAVTNDTQVIRSRFAQASQRYQRITLVEPDTTIVFSKIGFQPSRPQVSMRATFHCSDETINRIWTDGVRTVDMCTVAREETVPAWDITDQGTRVYGGHWAPCRKGTRWSDTKTTFQTKVEKHGASWAVRMITNGLIFCLDVRSKTLSLVEGLSNQSSIIPSVEKGSWPLPESLDLSQWLTVETIMVGDQVTVTIDGQKVVAITGVHMKAMLGDNLINTGSVAFGGPPGWITLYRDLSVKFLNNEVLYENPLSLQDAARTYADFQVGTNKLPCIIDGAKRDRASFGGDAFVTGRSIAYSTADYEAWKGTIQLLISHQTKDGYLGNLCPIQAPTHDSEDEPPYYGHYSLTYALLLVVSIKDYWLHSGDRSLVEMSWHQLGRHMKFTRQFMNKDGLIEGPPYLSMTWFPRGGPVFGVSTGLNLAYYDALNAMAWMSPDNDTKCQYHSQASLLKESLIRLLWNNKQGTMRPALSLATDGVFQDVNSYAATLGIFPKQSKAAEGILPSHATLPEAFRGIDGWDKFALTSPYASGFALEGLFAKGEGTKAIDLLLQVWGTMANQESPNYSGAHWEAMKTDGTPYNHDVSLAHGWSTWPVFLLPRYLAGVYPLEAGWKRIGVEPVFTGFETVEYSLESPHGCLSVKIYTKEPETALMRMLIPKGITAVVKAPMGWSLAQHGILEGSGTEISLTFLREERRVN